MFFEKYNFYNLKKRFAITHILQIRYGNSLLLWNLRQGLMLS